MSAPLVNKTTISSRNKVTQLNGPHKEILSSQSKTKTSMPPPSQIARNRILRVSSPAPSSASTTSRPSRLANGIPSSIKDGKPGTFKQNALASASTSKHRINAADPPPLHLINHNNNTKTPCQPTSTRLGSQTTSRVLGQSTKAALYSNQSRIVAPTQRLNHVAPLNSRSSSIVSSISSATTSKRPSVVPDNKAHVNSIPETNTLRKGLAKFSNPIECQRQYQALSLKLRQTVDVVEAREKEIDKLQAQLDHITKIGLGFATTVQYFALKLKLNSDIDLEKECQQLKSRVDELMVNEREYEKNLENIIDDYKNHLQVEHDLKDILQKELEEIRVSHSNKLESLENAHKNELDDLIKNHSTKEEELQDKIELLQSEVEAKSKELVDIRKEYESLNLSFNKLEETLTKDKDARVKYAQEKINQLQKDVDSLNSVLEMRLERIHALEKDNILLAEVQNELVTVKDTNKALNQQLESLNAALEKKREQYDKLIVDHEQTRLELKLERKERRRMTMKTEQLEYVLNESITSDNNMVFNSSIRDLNGADHLV